MINIAFFAWIGWTLLGGYSVGWCYFTHYSPKFLDSLKEYLLGILFYEMMLEAVLLVREIYCLDVSSCEAMLKHKLNRWIIVEDLIADQPRTRWLRYSRWFRERVILNVGKHVHFGPEGGASTTKPYWLLKTVCSELNNETSVFTYSHHSPSRGPIVFDFQKTNIKTQYKKKNEHYHRRNVSYHRFR